MTDIRMYILTTQKIYVPEDPMYHALQVGSAIREDLGYERDDMGENISAQYDSVRELTGFYWIWKNVKCDVVGISMSNRYFCYYEDIIRKYRIESLLEDYDVILPETDGPLLIAPKEIFDRYCDWLFKGLVEVEKEYRDPVSFFEERNYRIIRETTVETDLHLYREAEDAVVRKKAVLRKMLHPLILSYANGTPVDLLPLEPARHDFHGKLPVWICWWQGESSMPDIVKACLHSLRQNLPEESTEIRLITFENLSSYVHFPDFVMEKYHKKAITLTHLSDLLRVALLTLYGGFWLDATYLLNGIPADWILRDGVFFTQRFKELRYTDEIVVKGRWTANLMKAGAGNPLTRFVLNAFYCYWAACDTLLDYFLIDYLVLLAYEEIPSIREMIDHCPPSQPELYSMEILLNEAYDEKKWERLTRETCFFKLSYKHIFENETKDGRKTWYAKIMERYGSDAK